MKQVVGVPINPYSWPVLFCHRDIVISDRLTSFRTWIVPRAISSLSALRESIPTTVVSLSTQYPRGHNRTGIPSAPSMSLNRSNDPISSFPLGKRALEIGLGPRPPMAMVASDSFIAPDFFVEFFVQTLPNMTQISGRNVGKQAHHTPTAGSAIVHSHELLTTTVLVSVFSLLDSICPYSHNPGTYQCSRHPNLLFPYHI